MVQVSPREGYRLRDDTSVGWDERINESPTGNEREDYEPAAPKASSTSEGVRISGRGNGSAPPGR